MARPTSWRGMPSFDGAGDGRPERVTWRPTEPLTPPQSIVEAVRAMQVGGVLSLLEAGRTLVFRSDVREAFAAEVSRQGWKATAADLDAAATVALSISVVVALLGAVLWFTAARATRRGSKWARWGACVLLAIGLGMFFGGALATAGPLHRTLPLVMLLMGVWAVFRLWHRDSSAWIRYQTTPQG